MSNSTVPIWNNSGFERIKIKTAHGDLEEDVDGVTLARRTVGDDIELVFDAYCRWDDIENAIL
jgi:L-alanine-DL-glutamate epimerase-like enolase superfamily enzyme